MNYRNTPLKDIGLSPAQIIFARNIKDSRDNVLAYLVHLA